MKKIIISCLLWFILFPAFATEPHNLAYVKLSLMRYHDSGDYVRDIETVIVRAQDYLKKHLANSPHQGKPAIILDIDETALSNYQNMVMMSFGGTKEQLREAEMRGIDPAIEPTLKLYQFAKTNKVAVFFLTGRYEHERAATVANLERAGFLNNDGLFLRDGPNKYKHATLFKTAVRKQLTAQGYHIILNVGDQQSDLTGGYADLPVKIPNPYYFIP